MSWIPSLSRSVPGRDVLRVLVVVLVVGGTVPLAGVSAAHDTGAVAATDVAVDSQSSVDATAAAVDDDLLTEDGTVEVVVRLTEADVPASADESEVKDRLIDHADETQEPLVDDAADREGVSVENELWLTNAVVLTVDLDRVDVSTLADADHVEAVHENFEVSLPDEPASDVESADDAAAASNGDYRTTDGIAMVNATAVWDAYDARGEGVRVAVLDTGIDADHPDLDLYTTDPGDPTYPGGWAEFDRFGRERPDSTPYDSASHGTHVSGTVAGGDASGQYVGVAPEVELLHGLVLEGTSGSFAQIVAGMEWAVENDADVVSMSLGSDGTEDGFVEPVRNALAQNVTVVAAIGNDGEGTSNSPGNVYDALAVGAVNPDGSIASFSSGHEVDRDVWHDPPSEWPRSYLVPDVAAPGVGVTSTVPGGEYDRWSGTSMATPHVSGVIALSLSIDDQVDPADVTTAVLETAWKSGDVSPEKDHRYGHGIVDAKATADAVVSADLRGTVVDEDGEPIEDARVTVGTRTTTTDANGSYGLAVTPGDREVSVSADGYETDETTLRFDEHATVSHDVTLVGDSGAGVAGDADSLSPIVGSGLGVATAVVALALVGVGARIRGRPRPRFFGSR